LHGPDANENETKYLIVTDKSFKPTGELYYPDTSPIPGYSSWVPEFYGNVMLVNGVIWPKMTLKKGKNRFVLLNACQNRYLNVYFDNFGKKIPIELLRVDGDYYDSQIIVNELFATISSRIEFILDLTYA
jgi:spore coat protein A